jgi:hypothetical protein
MDDRFRVLLGDPPDESETEDGEDIEEGELLESAQDEAARDVLKAFKRDDPRALRAALLDLLGLMKSETLED